MWRGCRQASVLSLRDSSSCGPGGSAAGGHMTRPSAAPGASLGFPGASWALASVGGALLQQVVALRPRRGLEPYPTSRGGQAWGKHHTQTPHPPPPPTRRAFARASYGPGNSCLCCSFLCSDTCPLSLLSLSLLHCWSGRLAREKFCVWRGRHRSSVHWGSHSNCGSTGRSRGCRSPKCCLWC